MCHEVVLVDMVIKAVRNMIKLCIAQSANKTLGLHREHQCREGEGGALELRGWSLGIEGVWPWH